MVPKGWKYDKLENWIEEYREKSTYQDQFPVLTSSRNGLIPQNEYYGEGRITQRDNVGFHVIPRQHITYRSRSDDGLFFFNRNDTGQTGIISHYYPVFTFPNGNGDFFLAALNFWRRRFSGYAVGSSQLVLSLKALKSVTLPIPPKHVQDEIADVLITWDRAIEATEKLIANSETQKKALMQQLLTGKKRLPGFDGEWQTLNLEEIVEVDPETLPSSTDPNYAFRYISLSEVETGRILYPIPTVKFVNSPSRARKVVKLNDILMSTVRPNLQGFAKVGLNDSDLVASTGFAVLRAKQGTSVDFVYHSLFENFITSQIDSLVAGSNYPAINSSDVRKLRIRVPAFEEQKKISEMLNVADSAVHSLVRNAERLSTEKAALMQQLLTGKRRVKIEEAAA